MTATYDKTLPTDKDWVRFLTGDREGDAPVIADAAYSDEEILAVLADPEYPNRYLAAAVIADGIGSMGGNVLSKTLGNLSVSFGSDSGIGYDEVRRRLHAKGAEVELGKDRRGRSKVFRVLGTE